MCTVHHNCPVLLETRLLSGLNLPLTSQLFGVSFGFFFSKGDPSPFVCSNQGHESNIAILALQNSLF